MMSGVKHKGEVIQRLLVSEAKWVLISLGAQISTGGSTCALCHAYARGVPPESACVGCPVQVAVGASQCRGTPFMEYEGNRSAWVARQEADFLRSLRMRLEQGKTLGYTRHALGWDAFYEDDEELTRDAAPWALAMLRYGMEQGWVTEVEEKDLDLELKLKLEPVVSKKKPRVLDYGENGVDAVTVWTKCDGTQAFVNVAGRVVLRFTAEGELELLRDGPVQGEGLKRTPGENGTVRLAPGQQVVQFIEREEGDPWPPAEAGGQPMLVRHRNGGYCATTGTPLGWAVPDIAAYAVLP